MDIHTTLDSRFKIHIFLTNKKFHVKKYIRFQMQISFLGYGIVSKESYLSYLSNKSDMLHERKTRLNSVQQLSIPISRTYDNQIIMLFVAFFLAWYLNYVIIVTNSPRSVCIMTCIKTSEIRREVFYWHYHTILISHWE